MIQQGDIYWVHFQNKKGSVMVGDHPALILQSTFINQTRIQTIVVAGITSNTRLKIIPGTVVIGQESGLKKESIINTSQIHTIDKTDLERKIGKISSEKLEEVFTGIDHLFGR